MPWETILVAAVAGFVGAMVSTIRKSPKQETSPKHIRCESFEMVDATGVPRILMKMLPQGCPMLYITNPEGKPSMRLWVGEKGMPQIDLTGGGNDPRAVLLIGDEGEPGLLLMDKEGKTRGRFNMDKFNGIHLILDGGKRDSSIRLGQTEHGGAHLTIEEKRGLRAMFGLQPLLGDEPGMVNFIIYGDSDVCTLKEELQQLTKNRRGSLSLMASGDALALMIDGDMLYPKRRNEPTESGGKSSDKMVPNEG